VLSSHFYGGRGGEGGESKSLLALSLLGRKGEWTPFSTALCDIFIFLRKGEKKKKKTASR